MIVKLSTIVIDPKMQGMCKLPYPGHPKGCPNFNHKPGCPPCSPLFAHVVDMSKAMFAIINEFDLARHITRMRELHPKWTQRQLECCLYWQPTARKRLAENIKLFRCQHPNLVVDSCPEARGVNVTETLQRAGISLEWPPTNIVRQVAIAGSPIKGFHESNLQLGFMTGMRDKPLSARGGSGEG